MKFKFSFIIFLLLGCTLNVYAQSIDDLQDVDVDKLSEQQIRQISEEARARGLTPNQVAELAIQRGMPSSEAMQLRNRLNQASSSMQRQNGGTTLQPNRLRYTMTDTSRSEYFDSFFGADSSRDSLMFYQSIELIKYRTEQDSVALAKQKLKDKIFGFSLFDQQMAPFEPSLNIPTPTDYELAAGDELIIDLFGATEQTFQLTVSPDGIIYIENVGPVYVNGLTIEEAKQRIREKMAANGYSGLRAESGSVGSTSMQLSLGQIRSIKVSVIGEASQPGTYTLPSLATVFNALYSAGGPTVTGSFRKIDIIRGDSVVRTFDLYDLLINGDQTDNIRLNDQDIIKINPYLNRVEIEGEVKRPGIYETRNAETLADLLEFAGDFTGDAYTDRIKIIGSTNRQRRINDVGQDHFDEFSLRNGDYVTVQEVLDRFENMVEIKGAVFREGKYELTDTTTVSSLIKRAEGLRGDAFSNRGLIYREQEDYTLQTLRFDVEEVMNNPAENDIALKKNDLVVISSIFDLRDDYYVEIRGPVQEPGRYQYAEDMTLEDIIFQANGLTVEAIPYRIEVARRVDDHGEDFQSSEIANIFQFQIDESLKLDPGSANFELQPFDIVYIRKAPNYERQQEVVVSGEVRYPGTYTLKSKNDRISDIIERAGGLTPDAYTDGATLYREIEGLELRGNRDEEDIEGFYTQEEDSLQNAARRTGRANNLSGVTISKIGIELPRILDNSGSKYDLYVQNKDSLYIPKNLQTVIVKGGVFYPTSIRYDENLTYRDYITAAGGYNELAKENKSYVIYANGEVNRVKKFLFFKDYPEVKPGATLVVPEREQVRRLSPQERVTIYSAIVSTVAVISSTIFQILR